MSNKQKDRGKYFENKVAKQIRESWNLENYECTRSPNSGNGEFEFGDIFFTDPLKFPCIFECKFGYDWELSTFFPELSKQVIGFLKEVHAAADKYQTKMNKIPTSIGIVMSKPHYQTIYVTTDSLPIEKPFIISNTLFEHNNIQHVVYVYLFDVVLNVLGGIVDGRKG